jgi:hypothetical protein
MSHTNVVQALIEAAKRYEEQNAEALSNMENFDGLVEVVIPDGEYLSIDQLGEACSDAKRSTGKLKVVAFLKTGKVFVHQVASGYTHTERRLLQKSGMPSCYTQICHRKS